MAGIVDCKRNLQNTENAAKESFCGSGKGKNEQWKNRIQKEETTGSLQILQ